MNNLGLYLFLGVVFFIPMLLWLITTEWMDGEITIGSLLFAIIASFLIIFRESLLIFLLCYKYRGMGNPFDYVIYKSKRKDF